MAPVLTLMLLLAPAAAPEPLHAAPEALLTVDHDGDASGLACSNTVDNDCSLRSAIEHANDPGVDTILFDSSMTITLGSPLPTLSDDNTTISPLVPDRVVEIDGNGVGGNVFAITGSGVFIEGLSLYGSGAGFANIWIRGSAQGVTIANNIIGDDADTVVECGQSPDSHSGIYISSEGSTPAGARAWIYGNTIRCHEGIPTASPGSGIVIVGTATDNVLIGENQSGEAVAAQRNLIGGNAGDGIAIQNGASDNVVRNSALQRNDGYGIRLNDGDLNEIFRNTIADNGSGGILMENDSDSNRLGCPLGDPVPSVWRNVIGANDGAGVHLSWPDTETNFLFCNWIGLSDDGASAAPNASHGVVIDDGAHNNIVGATFDTSNTISGNDGDGVRISGGDDNLVQGNYIGVNDGGGAAIANGVSGVAIVGGAGDNTVGSDTEPDAGNIISGNTQNGVLLAGSGTTGNTVAGNLIGLSVTYTPIPNGAAGVTVFGADNTVIGPTASVPEQLIDYNEGAGIEVLSSDDVLVGRRNRVRGNDGAGIAISGDSSGVNVSAQEIHGNGGPAIDLDADGHTPNDAGDGDSGPNTLLNYPVITGSSGTVITGTACICTVHIYDAVGDPAAPGGGGVWVDSVATDGDGNWSATLPAGMTRLDVTVMAVDLALNSSEMAPLPHVFVPVILN